MHAWLIETAASCCLFLLLLLLRYCLSGSRKHAARISFSMYNLCLSLAVIVLLLQLRICNFFFFSVVSFIYSSLSFSSPFNWSVKGDFIPCFYVKFLSRLLLLLLFPCVTQHIIAIEIGRLFRLFIACGHFTVWKRQQQQQHQMNEIDRNMGKINFECTLDSFDVHMQANETTESDHHLKWLAPFFFLKS